MHRELYLPVPVFQLKGEIRDRVFYVGGDGFAVVIGIAVKATVTTGVVCAYVVSYKAVAAFSGHKS